MLDLLYYLIMGFIIRNIKKIGKEHCLFLSLNMPL